MKCTQFIVASILSSVAATLFGATTTSHAAPVFVARANVDGIIEPRMDFRSLDLLAAVATESGIDGAAAKLSQHLELPKEAWIASSSASAETLSLQEQPLRLAVNDAQRHSTVTSSTSSLSERLASSLSRSTSPNVSTRVGLKNGRKRLDDGASEKTLRRRERTLERVRRYNIRKQVSQGVKPGELTFTEAEVIDAHRERKFGYSIGSNIPAAKRQRAAKPATESAEQRALAHKLKAEAAVEAAQKALLEANAHLAAVRVAPSKSLGKKLLHRPAPTSPQARGALTAAKEGSPSKRAAPVPEESLTSTSNHRPSAPSPEGRGQEVHTSSGEEHFKLPDLNEPYGESLSP